MKNNFFYWIVLVIYALALWFSLIIILTWMEIESGSIVFMAAHIGAIMFFLWTRKYIGKWFLGK